MLNLRFFAFVILEYIKLYVMGKLVVCFKDEIEIECE